jgi:hypothetical protein
LKTIKISNQTHANLTSVVGQLIAEKGTMKTYDDEFEALLHRSLVLPLEHLREIKDFTEKTHSSGTLPRKRLLLDTYFRVVGTSILG